MLDTVTLRVVFVLIALSSLLLFAVGGRGAARARYATLWCCALLCFATSSALFVLNGTSAQVVANPMGNGFGVLGTLFVLASSRLLEKSPMPRWLFGVVPLLVLSAAVLGNPADDTWSGGTTYLTAMACCFAAASLSLWRIYRSLLASDGLGYDDIQYRSSVFTMAAGLFVTAAFYLTRGIAFVLYGPDSKIFENVFGAQVATLLVIVLLVIATYAMSTLSRAQYTTDLQEQAMTDGLTGMLNRVELDRRVASLQRRHRLTGHEVVVVGDLDQLKALNDTYGHPAGDRALAAVGSASRRHLAEGEIGARVGGDEFVFLLLDATRARQFIETVNTELSMVTVLGGAATPARLSFGTTSLDPKEAFADALARADERLYEAKALRRRDAESAVQAD